MALLSRRDPSSARDRRAALQERLMGATVDLLREGNSYADLAIETIAARAGVSRTTFYDYFADKRELLLAFGDTLLKDTLEETDEWRPGPDHEQTRAELRRILRRFIRLQRHPVAIAIVEATHYDPEVRTAWVATQERHIARTQRLLEWERDHGRFEPRTSPLEARARVLFWAWQQTILQELTLRPDLDEEALLDALVDLNLIAVRGRLP
jgi:TetR/AcrR family transcriptional regulator, ethionamide resistance regulator